MRKIVISSLLALAAAIPAAPAHADQSWILVSSGTADAGGLNVRLGILNNLPDAAKAGPCVPKSARAGSHGLGWNTWWSTDNSQIAYEWFNGGYAEVSAECATAVRVTVELTDYAPGGRPPVVRGAASSEENWSSSGGSYAVSSRNDLASLWVVYYDYSALPYMRGASLVETKVIGEYRDRTGRWIPYSCTVTYNTVQPTPTQPIVSGPTEAEACG